MRFGVGSGAIAFVILLASRAQPQAPAAECAPEPLPAAEEQRRGELYAEGRALADAGKLAEASDKFRAVIALGPTPRVYIALGVVQKRLGDTAAARASYGEALRFAEACGKADDADLARRSLDALGPAPPPPPPRLPAPPPPEPEAPDSWWYRHRVSLGLTGGAVALAGAGIGLGAATISKYDTVARACAARDPSCNDGEVAAVDNRAIATNVLLGAAGAAGVTAVAVFLFAEDSAEPTANTALTLRPGGATLLVQY